jgi:hypothetical protein
MVAKRLTEGPTVRERQDGTVITVEAADGKAT